MSHTTAIEEEHEATCNCASFTCRYRWCVANAVQEEEDRGAICQGCNDRVSLFLLDDITGKCLDCNSEGGEQETFCEECGFVFYGRECQECIDLKKYGEYPFEEEDDYCENCLAKSLDDCICREGDPE